MATRDEKVLSVNTARALILAKTGLYLETQKQRDALNDILEQLFNDGWQEGYKDGLADSM